MHLFFTNDIRGDLAYLPEEEAMHCTQVLRRRAGDAVTWVDGRGGWYEGRIVETGKKTCVLQIEQQEQRSNDRTWRLHLAVAPTKNIDRTEWLLEKAVEIGLDTFTPLWCERSERKVIRMDRLEKIALAAMKQSLQAHLPLLEAPIAFNDFAARQTGSAAQLFIAHCREEEGKRPLQHNCAAGQDVCILIGPEGDFSESEVEKALLTGFAPVSLGANRLRTETAALVACQIVHFVNS
ncbi:MAG: 16S rRNA (uracil(1498)-N(3))-methyltransferase [Saprospiraceae bacterium]|nr:16S rRNA (uracil(1498)-N(3))-methyltransferase [Saprospiraceae bacterium]